MLLEEIKKGASIQHRQGSGAGTSLGALFPPPALTLVLGPVGMSQSFISREAECREVERSAPG